MVISPGVAGISGEQQRGWRRGLVFLCHRKQDESLARDSVARIDTGSQEGGLEIGNFLLSSCSGGMIHSEIPATAWVGCGL